MVSIRKIHKLRLGRYAIAVVLVTMVLGYIFFRNGSEQESEMIKEDEPIRIALIRINQEGLTYYGDMFLHGVQLTLDQINEDGGIEGKSLELVVFDDPCGGAVDNISRKITSDHKIAIAIGPMCSSSALALGPVFKKASLPTIMPTVTSPLIAHDGWVFRNIYNDDFQGQCLAFYAKKVLHLKRIAVLYENSTFGARMKDTFTNEARKVDLEVVAIASYMKGCADFEQQLKLFREKESQAIFLAAHYEEGATIAHQAQRMQLSVNFLAPDTLAHPGFIEMGRDAVEGFLICKPFLLDLENDKIKKFLDQFVDKFHEMPNWIAVNAYDAAGIAVAAIRKVGSNKRAIRKYLSRIDSPKRAYHGISGPIYFDKNGNCIKPVCIATIKGDRFVPAPKQLSSP